MILKYDRQVYYLSEFHAILSLQHKTVDLRFQKSSRLEGKKCIFSAAHLTDASPADNLMYMKISHFLSIPRDPWMNLKRPHVGLLPTGKEPMPESTEGIRRQTFMDAAVPLHVCINWAFQLSVRLYRLMY